MRNQSKNHGNRVREGHDFQRDETVALAELGARRSDHNGRHVVANKGHVIAGAADREKIDPYNDRGVDATVYTTGRSEQGTSRRQNSLFAAFAKRR